MTTEEIEAIRKEGAIKAVKKRLHDSLSRASEHLVRASEFLNREASDRHITECETLLVDAKALIAHLIVRDELHRES